MNVSASYFNKCLQISHKFALVLTHLPSNNSYSINIGQNFDKLKYKTLSNPLKTHHQNAHQALNFLWIFFLTFDKSIRKSIRFMPGKTRNKVSIIRWRNIHESQNLLFTSMHFSLSSIRNNNQFIFNWFYFLHLQHKKGGQRPRKSIPNRCPIERIWEQGRDRHSF